jgi:tetratricopeptide (TPR) repeat protein
MGDWEAKPSDQSAHHDPEQSAHEVADAAVAARALWSVDSPTVAMLLPPHVLEHDAVAAEVVSIDAQERRVRSMECGLEFYFRECPQLEAKFATMPRTRRVLFMAELMSGVDAKQLLTSYPKYEEDVHTVSGLCELMFESGNVLDAQRHAPGEVLGKYKLIGLLGSGSFARTWLAWDTALERFIAFKVLNTRPSLMLEKHGEETSVMREARAAAALDHPAIVHVHEAGVMDEEDIYYIDNQFVGDVSTSPDGSITWKVRTLADMFIDGPVAASEAARIMAAVAAGVAAAHARGITHRDIKPANILLTSRGEPLLADFGLAVQRDEQHTARPAGTPAYMAPELARREPATPLADVFSLGATLRALLTGTPPRSRSDAGANATFKEAVASARRQPLSPLEEEAPGTPRTLCSICDRATAFNIDARYASADLLSADLRAFLENRPTMARPPGAVGTATLWYRRHRALALLLGVSLGVAVGGTAIFIYRLNAERKRALQAERAAVESNIILQTTNRFVARTFNSTRGLTANADFTVKQAIDLGTARVGTTFAERPLVEAAVRHFWGEAAVGAGAFEVARAQLERALTIREERLGATDPFTIATRRHLAELMLRERRVEEGRALFAQIVTDLGEERALANADGLRALVLRGDSLRKERKYAESEALLLKVRDAYDALATDGSADQQSALNSLVTLYIEMREYAGAIAAQKRIIELHTARLGADDISTLNAVQALGWCFRESGDLVNARAVYEDVLLRYERTAGRDHFAWMNIALELAPLMRTEDAAGALALVREVERRSSKFAPDSSVRIKCLILLGPTLEAAGELAEARQAYEDAVAKLTIVLESKDRWLLRAVRGRDAFLARHGDALAPVPSQATPTGSQREVEPNGLPPQ